MFIRNFSLLLIGLAVFACNDDDNRNGNTRVSSTARWGTGTSGGRVANTTAVQEFWVNITDIGFDDDDDDDQYLPSLRGPFALGLITNGNTNKRVLADVGLPTADFDDLEFRLAKSTDAATPLNNKTVFVKGTVSGKPFEFSHNGTIEVEVDFEDDGKFNAGTEFATLDLIFDVNTYLDSSILAKIAAATDNDGDGIIEIAPDDQDGNNSLAAEIWAKLPACIDLEDDDDDDMDGDGQLDGSDDDDDDGD